MFFFFNITSTTEIYTLSLHDALPIFQFGIGAVPANPSPQLVALLRLLGGPFLGIALLNWLSRGAEPSTLDRKSTRLNSSHVEISYAVFCLKKKKIHYPPLIY